MCLTEESGVNRAVVTINTFVAVLAAAELIALQFVAEDPGAVVQGLLEGMSGVVLVALALVVIALNVVAAVRDVRQGAFRRNLEVHTDSGASVVNVTALEQELAMELSREKDITALTLHLGVRGENQPVLCTLHFKLHRQDDVMARVDAFKTTVRETFTRMIPNVGVEINAIVTDFVHDEPKPAVEAPAASGNEFEGPVYPVGEGEDQLQG